MKHQTAGITCSGQPLPAALWCCAAAAEEAGAVAPWAGRLAVLLVWGYEHRRPALRLPGCLRFLSCSHRALSVNSCMLLSQADWTVCRRTTTLMGCWRPMREPPPLLPKVSPSCEAQLPGCLLLGVLCSTGQLSEPCSRRLNLHLVRVGSSADKFWSATGGVASFLGQRRPADS